jgi:hypothetical protein
MKKGSAGCCFCRHGDVSTGTVQCPRGGWCGLVCALRGPRQSWPRSLQTGHSAGSEGPGGKSAPLPCPVTGPDGLSVGGVSVRWDLPEIHNSGGAIRTVARYNAKSPIWNRRRPAPDNRRHGIRPPAEAY